MAHIRKHIRDWVKFSLKGSAEAGSRVEVRRTLPLPKSLTGARLLVAIQGDQADDAAMGGTQDRTVRVRVTAVVKGDAEASEDTLDALGVHAERVFGNDPTLGGVALDSRYLGAEFAFSDDGERTLATAAFTFAVLVTTARGDPETPIAGD